MTGFWFWMDHWQTLIGSVIGGVLTIIAGGVAYLGALAAARRQVKAIQAQIVDMQAERTRTDERRLVVVKWAVRAEAERLDKEVARVRPLLLNIAAFKEPLSGMVTPRLLIERSPLLCGEREDAALLGDTFSTLVEAATTLNNYNHRVETTMSAMSAMSVENLARVGRQLLEQLADVADKLKK
jgi:hypothetical protein